MEGREQNRKEEREEKWTIFGRTANKKYEFVRLSLRLWIEYGIRNDVISEGPSHRSRSQTRSFIVRAWVD